PEGQAASSTLDVLLQTFAIMGQSINRYELKDADVVIQPALANMKGSDFNGRNLAVLLEEMVGNLLDMSRIEAGVMALDYEECYPAELLGECVERCRQSGIFEARSVTLDAPIDLPPVAADYRQLQRVVLNLLTNAAKYSEAGAPIAVWASVAGDGGARELVVAVQDRGSGIPEEEQPRIFERFYRSPRRGPSSRTREGFGLGLAICRALVEAHGGILGVASRQGKGSTFSFTIPFERP
ncbi:MAG: ATP-binding protein, partial [Chloroflexota bacterium]